MNHLDCDWHDLIQRLAIWDELPLDARRAFLDTVEPMPFPRDSLGSQLAPLALVRFVYLLQDDRRCRLPEELRAFRRAMRSMRRHPLFEGPTEEALTRYIIENFTRAEGQGMMGRRPRIYAAADLARRIGALEWPETFLQADDPERWEDRHDGREHMYSAQRDRDYFFASVDILVATKAIWRWLSSSPEPRTIAALQEEFHALAPTELAAALFAGIRYALLFPSLDPKTLGLRIGVWPAIARRLNRPPAPRPAPVEPKEVFQSGFLIENMIQLLALCCAEPPRLRVNDGRLFARTQKELLAHAIAIPEWVQRIGVPDGKERMDLTLNFLVNLGLVDTRQSRSDGLRLVPTEDGRRWLAGSEKERMRTILDELRAQEKEPEDAIDALYADMDRLPFFQTSPWGLSAGQLTQLYAKALAPCAGGDFVDLRGLLAHAAQHALPLTGESEWDDLVARTFGWYRGWHEPTREEIEADWKGSIVKFLAFPLIPLGTARVGRSKRGEISVAVTPLGRYLFGLDEDFECESIAAGEVLVQPNFEIVFLAPAPATEARIARFAERRGQSVGTLFEITRASVFGAAAGGMTSGDVLGLLRETSNKEIPPNVAREIEGWFARCRHVEMNPAVLIHCPDAETAARVLSVGGKLVRPVTETVVELISPRNKAKLVRKMRGAGVFVV